ncbi:Hsp20/alpha crystallin family protein [Desulfosarcina sp.]|uniref:Hsp20/alpha crystallin family protein n=1 Tax=Desulfosarcina sp. TaxID=2027861 RepID=UPI00397106FE
MADSKELQVKDKQALATAAEQTRPGLVFTPVVDIFETDNEIRLLADMPGVKADDLNIDLRDNVLTISGDVRPWESAGETDLLVEFEIGRFYRQFALAETIDQNRIEAGLTDGVLNLTLPKHAKATPRKITVATA